MQAAGGHREEEVAGPGLQHQEALAVCSFVLSQSEHSLEGLMGSWVAVPLLLEEGIKMTAANKRRFLISRLIKLISRAERFGG